MSKNRGKNSVGIDRLSRATKLTKQYDYFHGQLRLSFTLDMEKREELVRFREILLRATGDLAADIEELDRRQKPQ